LHRWQAYMHHSKFDVTARPMIKRRCFPLPRTTCPSRRFPPLYRIWPGGPLGEHRPRQDGRLGENRPDAVSCSPRHDNHPSRHAHNQERSGQTTDARISAATPPSRRLSRVSTRNVRTHQQTAQTFISSRERQPSRVFRGPILSRPDRIGRSSRQSALFPPPYEPDDNSSPVNPAMRSHATALSSGPWIHTSCRTQHVAGRACPNSKGRDLCLPFEARRLSSRVPPTPRYSPIDRVGCQLVVATSLV
jgi:hypothetical protein